MSDARPPIDHLRQQAAAREPGAMFRLASALVLQGDIAEAHDLHARAAQAGHTPAKVETARMLLHGIGTTVDVPAAITWLLSAEADGETVAGYYLALIAVGNRALPFDQQVNARVLAAMQAGYPPALRAAAIHFGRKPQADDQELCVRLLDQAAQAGDSVAALLLAERIALGEGCVADEEAASQLLKQLSAAGIAPLPRISLLVPASSSPHATPNTLELQEALQVPYIEWLCQTPRIGVLAQLLSADECRLLMATSTPRLQRSRTVDPATGLPLELEVRTSSDASHDAVTEDLSLRLVQLRMATAAGVDLLHAESLTVLRYQPGEEYRPHRDYVPPGSLERDHPESGNRARTICAYLNSVQAGGETRFPLVDVTVSPQPGSAVVFDNLMADGRPDAQTLHAGLPVQEGEKWLATLWLRQRPYRRF